MIWKEAVYASWLIMVFDNICKEAHLLTFLLGMEQSLFEIHKLNGLAVIPSMFAHGKGMGGEIEHCGEMSVFTYEFN